MKKTYVDYGLEFKRQEEALSQFELRRMLREKHVPYLYNSKTITSGKLVEVEVYPLFEKGKGPGKKKKASRKAQKNLNDKNARKMFIRLLCANFTNGDYFGTFNYEKHPATIEEAEKIVVNYIRRLNHKRKKMGLPNMKYLIVTEQSKNGKIHHHIIMDSKLDRDTVEDLWKHGKRNHLRRLAEDDFGLTGLATYLSKDPKGRKRWRASRNLQKPKVTSSLTKFRRGRVLKMASDHNFLEATMKKKYPHFKFLDFEVRENEINGLYYIYVRMMKKRE